jgi:predicted Zn finger-like uncharacterized protein
LIATKGFDAAVKLICPNCDTLFSVQTKVLPTVGQDVRCSNCQHVWFFGKQDIAPVPRTIDPEVKLILQQEAEHSAAQRKSKIIDTRHKPASIHQKLGKRKSKKAEPTPTPKKVSQTKKRKQHEKLAIETEVVKTLNVDSITAKGQPPKNNTKNGQFDDITVEKNQSPDEVEPLTTRQKLSILAWLILGLMTVPYLLSRTLTETFPQFSDLINLHVEWVNAQLNSIKTFMQPLIAWVDDQARWIKITLQPLADAAYRFSNPSQK